MIEQTTTWKNSEQITAADTDIVGTNTLSLGKHLGF
jgi:hypothetical protein